VGILKEFIGFISNMRSLWGQVKNFTLTNKPTGAGIANFIEQNADPRISQAIQNRPEWQAAKRSTVDNQAELKNVAFQSAQNIPGFQGKSPQEAEEYMSDMANNLGFI